MKVASKFAIAEVALGEGGRHLFCPDKESLGFCRDEQSARSAAEREIKDGTKAVAILRVETILVARPEFYEVKPGNDGEG